MDKTFQIPGYRIEKHIGSGAMAAVYLATQQSLERKVALKLMGSSMLSDLSFCERFLKEGKIIAQLNHPNIITIYDIGIVESCYYMAMEYVDGGHTLKELIQQGMSTQQARSILRQIAIALGYAHDHGFVHRDVKPANILLRSDGSPVLSDFGIAKAFDGTQMTAAGSAMGTPSYMSPEQIRGEKADARSDLYSLGVVFFEMLTGDKPYKGDSIPAVLWKHVHDPVPCVPSRFADFQAIIDHTLVKERDQRFADAQALVQTLDGISDAAVIDTTDATDVTNICEAQTKPRTAVHEAALQSQGSPSGAEAHTAARDTGINPPKEEPTINAAPATANPGATPPASGRFANRFRLLGLALLIPIAVAAGYLLIPHLDGLTTQPTAVVPLDPPVLDPKTQQEVASHLKIARAHFDNGFLSDYEMPYSNATYSYKQVLALDPFNTEAKDGLRTIADTYETMARNAESTNSALLLVKAGLSAAPDHPGLRNLFEQFNRQRQSSP